MIFIWAIHIDLIDSKMVLSSNRVSHSDFIFTSTENKENTVQILYYIHFSIRGVALLAGLIALSSKKVKSIYNKSGLIMEELCDQNIYIGNRCR
jgi:hypothetical protein